MNEFLTEDKNFTNIIERKFEFVQENSIHERIKLVQQAAECAWSFEIPIYLLNLWKSYCRDAINACTLNNYKSLDLSNSSIALIAQGVQVKLNDMESLFNYYYQTTLKYATRKENFKKSIEKEDEALKFVPINLHLEKCFISNATYEFTSCGAFTFAHDYSTKNNEFDGECSLVAAFFYTLKQAIIISDEIGSCIASIDLKEQRLRCLYSIKSRLFTFSAEITNIFAKNLDKITFFQTALNEQFQFFKVKFDSFLINTNFLISNSGSESDRDALLTFLSQILSLIIEFLNAILTSFISKFEFVDNCALLSQCLTTTACAIHLKLHTLMYKDLIMLDFYKRFGLLVQYESLLSCGTNEAIKLADHLYAIRYLENVFIHLPQRDSSVELNASLFQIDFAKNGVHFYFYTNTKSNSHHTIRLVPVLLNVGINELAISSHILGTSVLQSQTIQDTLATIESYYIKCQSLLEEDKKHEIRSCLSRYRSLQTTSGLSTMFEKFRPVEYLELAARLVRLFDGVRVTNCKSGKDRTAMSVSLEQCRILQRHHGLNDTLFQTVLDQLRRNGTRNYIAFKNVGRAKYAFNKLRLNLLPKLYRCPQDCCVDDLET